MNDAIRAATFRSGENTTPLVLDIFWPREELYREVDEDTPAIPAKSLQTRTPAMRSIPTRASDYASLPSPVIPIGPISRDAMAHQSVR